VLLMRANFLGCPINILSMAETVDLARAAMLSRKRLQHVALNVAKFVHMRSDPLLAADVTGSDLIGIDGMGIVVGARLFGLPVRERVPGIDLLQNILEVCANEGFRPFFLGATPDVVRRAAAEIVAKYPAIRFAGMRDGYFHPDQEETVVAEIRVSRADCLFIGIPTPRKERFLASHRDRLDTPFIMGVGGSFDVLAGEIRRAPAVIQALGLEWLYRVYQEPRRMWRRYLTTNSMFAVILLNEGLRRCRNKLRSSSVERNNEQK
jgi:N-acetylglucosaminyldiphosphoundecaprenol N-acetyl-beta-D-mannosaminyltransferase